MAKLSVGILGLGRTGTSIGLALRRYMKNGGKHQFEIIGHDLSPDAEKRAQKMGAINRSERRLSEAAAGRDLVIMALSYDEMRPAYKTIAPALRDGTVVLDVSSLKRPSLEWAKEFFTPEHHLVGITPIVNPRFLFDNNQSTDNAQEELFDNGVMLITPSVGCEKDAVDLAYNFCVILGCEPRFLDPVEHDTLMAFTDGLPSLLGVALFYMLMKNPAWGDMQRFTGSAFGVLTRPLHDIHPDAMRDEWLSNREVLSRALNEMIKTLQHLQALLVANDRSAVEALAGSASEEYEKWINHRYNADWDKEKRPEVSVGNTMMGTLLGGKLSERLFGKSDTDKK